MKEFFEIIFSFNFEKIFYSPTKNTLLQFFRYAFVGGWATLADWAVLYALTEWFSMHYLVSAIIGFIVGLTVNFILSKTFVFSGEKNEHSQSTEFIIYAIIGVIGLLMTEGIMYVITDVIGSHYMIGKIIATLVVFIWNFTARKIVLYR